MPNNGEGQKCSLKRVSKKLALCLIKASLKKLTMRTFIGIILWAILFVICWPLALILLVLFPLIWLILLPFRIVGFSIGLFFKIITEILMLPFRLVK
jgi:hypothetical protein